MNHWHVRKDGRIVGPVSIDQLRKAVVDGKVTRSCEVAIHTNGPWKRATDVTALNSLWPAEKPRVSKAPAVKSSVAVSNPVPAPPPIAKVPSTRTQKQITVPPRKADALEQYTPRREQTIWTGYPSQASNIPVFVICGLFSWLIVPAIAAIWQFLITNCISYELTTERLNVNTGVFSKRFDAVELYRVKDTRITQSFFQRMCGLATVTIVSSDRTTPIVHLLSIPMTAANEIRESIRKLSESLRQLKGVREIDYV